MFPVVTSAPVTNGSPQAPPAEDRNDLGLGAVLSSQSPVRLLRRDGTINTRRRGLGWWESQSAYHTALAMTWPKFLLTSAAMYIALNVVFALVFMACGPAALVGAPPETMGGWFGRAFFFSIETFATIGYGNIAPVGVLPHLVMVVESLVGLMSQALITGLLFARFSRPNAAIKFSTQMLVAPYRGGRALMFRIVNKRETQIIDLTARVSCSWLEQTPTGPLRRFRELALERSSVMLFPLSWTIVHPIDDKSPLRGLGPDDLKACSYEFIVLMTGTDEMFATTVNTRTSYRHDEVVWGGKFRNIFNQPDGSGNLSVDVHRLDEFDPVPLPDAAAAPAR